MARIYFATIAAALLAFLFYGAGCTRRSLGNSDGGSTDMASVCGGRSAGTCELDPRCVLRAGCCGGPSYCATDGSPEPACECPLDCHSLDETACAAAGAACTADYCFECSCTPTFVGCRRPTDATTACPGLGCPQPLCKCDGLSEGACIAAEKTMGCSPTYCPDCNGGQYYSSCSGPNSGGVCTALCPQKTCHTTSDCTNSGYCLQPGAPVCGGACVQMPCSSDGQCGTGQVCDSAPCNCTNSGKSCIAGCSRAGCAEGETCGNDDHCLPTFCNGGAGQCPKFFTCIFPPGPGNSHCQRNSCSADPGCPGGYCVNGECFSSLGTCQLPVP